MAPSLWDHFHKGELQNLTQYRTYCKACVAHYQEDNVTVAGNGIAMLVRICLPSARRRSRTYLVLSCRLNKAGFLMFGHDMGSDLKLVERYSVTMVGLLKLHPGKGSLATSLVSNDVKNQNCKSGEFRKLFRSFQRFPDHNWINIILQDGSEGFRQNKIYEDEDPSERGRALVSSPAGWRTYMAKWIGAVKEADREERLNPVIEEDVQVEDAIPDDGAIEIDSDEEYSP
ncbi:hypothetical protein B0H10DRAFT_1937748 [Mycena sp. CBHHK59/15]|nr:hypothetical protein B0H10DRAFT_1937748 [Mycena sp. CBHHK59/15]